jgi:hypothetical protein
LHALQINANVRITAEPSGGEMTITNSNREDLLRRLTKFAGDPTIVEDALKELSERDEPPTLEQVLYKILEIQQAARSPGRTRTDAAFATAQ